MTKNQRSSWKPWIVAICSMIVAVIGISMKFDFYYDLNDDTVIKDIISGIYTGTPSGYNIQMLYPFSALIALFYRAIPGIAWYGLFLCGIEFGCIALMLARIYTLLQDSNELKKFEKVIIYLISFLLIISVLLYRLVIIQFTVASAMAFVSAIFLYYTEKEHDGISVLPIILVSLSFAIRTELCLMLFPFLAVVGIAKWSAELKPFEKRNLIKYIGTIGVCFALMASLYGADRLAYGLNSQNAEWKEYKDFFDARTLVYDFYGIPDYDTNKEFYDSLELTREQYTLLNNYNFAIDESINSTVLYKIVDYQKQKLNHIVGSLYTKKSLKEGIWLYKQQIINQKNGIWSNVLLIFYFLYVFVLFRYKKFKKIWNIILLVMARSALWMYLLMVDRSIDRVTFPLLIAEIVVIISFLLTELKDYYKTNQKVFNKMGLVLVSILIMMCFFTDNYPKLSSEYQQRERIVPVYKALQDYVKENNDSYFILDVYSSTSYDGVYISEKIFKDVDNSFRNYDICGGWLNKSPLTKEKLQKYNIDTEETGLLESKAYFVSYADKDLLWLTEYYASKGIKIDIETIDSIYANNELVYNIYKINEVK